MTPEFALMFLAALAAASMGGSVRLMTIAGLVGDRRELRRERGENNADAA